jgi:hypothetical protein
VISQRRMAHRKEQLDVLADYFVADVAKVMPIRGGQGVTISNWRQFLARETL